MHRSVNTMIFALAPLVLPLAPLSAAAIVERSQKAYDSVRTFEQDVVGGFPGMKGTAHVSFSRPGRLRASGNALGGSSKYDLLCDGKSTWVLNAGTWTQAQSPEMGIATITGISGNAGTLVPAMLMHTPWGRLNPSLVQGAPVTEKTVGGKRLFVIHATKPTNARVWIDAKDYFVARTETEIMGRTITVVFAPPKVNHPIPAGRFRR